MYNTSVCATRTVTPSTRTVTLVVTSTCTFSSTGNRATCTCVRVRVIMCVFCARDNSNREQPRGTIIITDSNVTYICNSGDGTFEGRR